MINNQNLQFYSHHPCKIITKPKKKKNTKKVDVLTYIT